MGKQWKQCQTLFFWAPKSLPATTTQVMESLGGAESDRGRLPGEGEQDTEDFPGSRLGFGAPIFRALGLFAAPC